MTGNAGQDHDPYLGGFILPDDGRVHGEIRYGGPKHLLSLGPPGANKTAGLIIPNVQHLPRSMIIVDPKGQIAAITARHRARMGKVVVLNPCDPFKGELPHLKSRGFNPLAALDPDSETFAGDARDIAATLIPVEANEMQKHFPEGARDLFTIMIMHERRTKGEAASLVGVRRALTARTVWADPKTKRKPVSGFMKTIQDIEESDYPPMANLAGRLLDRFGDASSGNTGMQDVIDAAIRPTNRLDDPPIARDLSGDSFDFATLREEITTVYLILPTAELKTYGFWLRLVVGAAIRAFYQTPLPPPEKTLPNVLFILDEFAALGYLEAIDTALNTARDYGFQIWPFLQYLRQIKKIYPDSWDGFFAGAGAVTAFAPGDWETAEYLSQLAGQRTVIVESNNEGTNPQGGATSGRSWSQDGQPLIRPEDLMRMPPGQMLCMVEPEPMPLFTFAPPYPFTRYGDGLDENPYYRNRKA